MNFVDPLGLFNWGKGIVGVLSVTDGFTMIGVGATVGTAILTENPILTGIIAVEMTPVIAAGAWDIYHGVHLIVEAFHDEEHKTSCK